MKKTLILFCFILLLASTSRGQRQFKTLATTITKLDQFKKKEKFNNEQFYPGISNAKVKSLLTEKINNVATDFQALLKTNKATDKGFQNLIKTGLERFSDISSTLDTNDREKICTYLEELMDIIELESSGGHLNMFMYGFDPTKKQ